MLFNSWAFAAFFVATFISYYSLPLIGVRGIVPQITLLTLASFIFYSYENPVLLILLVISILGNAIAARAIIATDVQSERARRLYIVLGAVAFNLAILSFFKYAALLAGLLVPLGLDKSVLSQLQDIPLPIGISFYTFQGISLLVDLYRHDYREPDGFSQTATPAGAASFIASQKAETTGFATFTLRVGFFISFFPQLIAGPILKAKQFMPQIEAKRFGDIPWNSAIKYLILGYFFKMVIADNLKEVTIRLTNPETVSLMPNLDLILLVYAYSFQIFADFNGYSLIAMGLAGLLGYKIPVNFNFPYIATSITSFWQRWHISLSSWLREYLYIPLGGNRRGDVRTYINLFIVMFLGGLWHGAAWSYAVWGMTHGALLAIERYFNRHLLKGREPGPAFWPLTVLQILVTFSLVSWAWLLFALPNFTDVINYMQAIAGNRTGLSPQTAFMILLYATPVVLYHFWGFYCERFESLANMRAGGDYQWVETLIHILLLFLIITNAGSAGEFIYFQF